MTNNYENHEHDPEMHDDFIDHEQLGQGGNRGIGGNLAEAWRTRPLFKFMVLIVAVFAVFVAGFSFFGGSSVNSDLAHLAKPPNMKEPPGGAVSPYMRQQTELADKERVQQAINSNGSALPTPIGQAADTSGFGGTEKKDDPLNELRAETERLRQQQVQTQQQQQQMQQQIQQRQPEQFDNSLAEAMQQQMKQLLDSWKPQGLKTAEVSKPDDKSADKNAETNANGGATSASASSSVHKNIVNAGTVSYAELLTEANSDVPGPILAQIVSGPLSGARAVGSFQVSDGYEKYLVLHFALADKKGTDYQINAYALDPDTTLGGMATEVDERYFTRVILPAAAGFLQGMGQALGQGGTSITTNGTTTVTTLAGNGYKQGIYNGMGQAANTMSQFFQQQANLTKPLVRIAAGTPIGLFFITPVADPNSTDAATTSATGTQPAGVVPANAAGNVQGYGGMTTYPQGNGYGGYPGSTVNGYGNGNGANAASAVPYPNYAVPGYGYYGNTVSNRMNGTTASGGIYTPYGQQQYPQ